MVILKIKKFFDSNALWLSMVIGCAAAQWFAPLKPLLTWLIFFMLFFTFCKIDPKDLRLHRWHWVVLSLQLGLSVATYYALMKLTGNPVLAQGLMLCFIMPTATAAPIIAGKLGGSIQNLTTFTLLSNFATAIVVPAFFPLVNPAAGMTFWSAFWIILRRISPLLLGPFFAAWILRIAYKAKTKQDFVLSTGMAVIPFYLWVASIVILSATVTETVIATLNNQLSTILWLLFGSFIACLFQFGVGKLIGFRMPAPSKGKDYQDVLINPAAAPKTMAGVSSITAGQAFGQKNTSLGVWMAQMYLNPLSALGAAAYIIWQNIFNSAQLANAARKK